MLSQYIQYINGFTGGGPVGECLLLPRNKISMVFMVKNKKAVKKSSGDEFWVFGYGSLIWNPGFAFVEKVQAKIFGYHRCLCVASTTYRGTAENPGLVLGLDRGGSTTGMAFRVAKEHVNDVLAYLEDREQITKIYCPHFAKAHLIDGRTVRAYTFIARHDHEQYAGPMSMEKCAKMVAAGVGEKGSSLEYLANTVEHLDKMGIKDTDLHKVLKLALKIK